VLPPNHTDVVALGSKRLCGLVHQFPGFIRGIIQHLDFVPVFGIIHFADRPHDPLCDIVFIVKGNLGRDSWQIRILSRVTEAVLYRLNRRKSIRPAAAEQENHDIAIETVAKQQHCDGHIAEKKATEKPVYHRKNYLSFV